MPAAIAARYKLGSGTGQWDYPFCEMAILILRHAYPHNPCPSSLNISNNQLRVDVSWGVSLDRSTYLKAIRDNISSLRYFGYLRSLEQLSYRSKMP